MLPRYADKTQRLELERGGEPWEEVDLGEGCAKSRDNWTRNLGNIITEITRQQSSKTEGRDTTPTRSEKDDTVHDYRGRDGRKKEATIVRSPGLEKGAFNY